MRTEAGVSASSRSLEVLTLLIVSFRISNLFCSDSDGKLTSASEEELQVVDRMFLYYMDTVEVPLSKLILERRLK